MNFQGQNGFTSKDLNKLKIKPTGKPKGNYI